MRRIEAETSSRAPRWMHYQAELRQILKANTMYDENGCLVWTGRCNAHGEGIAYVGHCGQWLAANMAMALAGHRINQKRRKAVPACGNSKCVNAEHLKTVCRSSKERYTPPADRVAQFLRAYRKAGSLTTAAKAIGAHRASVYEWLKLDADFAHDFAMARDDFYVATGKNWTHQKQRSSVSNVTRETRGATP